MKRFEDKLILIVDDEADLREILRDEFELEGAKIMEASNGREAMEKLKVTPEIALVISDVRMPGGNGVELLDLLRKMNATLPPLIMVSGFADITHREAITRGAVGLLAKPFDLEHILVIAKKAIEDPNYKALA